MGRHQQGMLEWPAELLIRGVDSKEAARAGAGAHNTAREAGTGGRCQHSVAGLSVRKDAVPVTGSKNRYKS